MESLLDMDWTEKYRPKSLSQVLGNPQAVQTMRRWAKAWNEGVPEKRALILHGPPGIGKTSAALVLGEEMGWRVLELNASDTRNQENIKKVSGATLYESFSEEGKLSSVRAGQRTLVIFDEADNLYERRRASEAEKEFSDKGGKEEIVKTVQNTLQPVILIANDLYGLTKNSPLKRLSIEVGFRKLNAYSMRKALMSICQKEGVDYSPDAIEWLVKQADGDLRGAINDLQSAARTGKYLSRELVEDLGMRDTKISIFRALEKIF